MSKVTLQVVTVTLQRYKMVRYPSKWIDWKCSGLINPFQDNLLYSLPLVMNKRQRAFT